MTQYRSESSNPLVPSSGRPVQSQVVRENFQVLRGAASLWVYPNDPADLTVNVTAGNYQIDPAEVLTLLVDTTSPTLDTVGDQGFGVGSVGESRSAVLTIDDTQPSPVLQWLYGPWVVGVIQPSDRPMLPTDKVVLAEVHADYNDTEILADSIFDLRPLMSIGGTGGGGVTGPQGATGIAAGGPLPSDTTSGTAFSTSSTTFQTVATTSVTLGFATSIFGLFTFDIDSATANATAEVRVVIDPSGTADDGQVSEFEFVLADLTTGAAVQHISASLPAGTYDVEAQLRSPSNDTVTLNNFQLSAIGLEGLQGPTGIQGVTGPAASVGMFPGDFAFSSGFTTSSTSFTTVTGAGTSITITADDTRILGLFTADIGVDVANRDVAIRVVIGADNGPEVEYTFQLTDEVKAGVVQFLSDPLMAGTYSVDAEIKVSNADTIVTLNNFNLSAMGLEGVQGATGIPGPAGANLDATYLAGNTINIAGPGPVEIDNTTSSTDSLTLTTSTGSGDALVFNNTGTGADIRGTGNTWEIEPNGDARFDGKLTVVGGIDPIYLQFDPTAPVNVPTTNSFFVDSMDGNKLKYIDNSSVTQEVTLGAASNTLQEAYDSGQSINTDSGPIDVTNTIASPALIIEQSGAADGVQIEHSGTSAGNALQVVMSDTGNVSDCVFIQNNGGDSALLVQGINTTNSSACINIANSSAGSAQTIAQNNLTATAPALSINNSSLGLAVQINNSTNADAMQVNSSQTSGRAVRISAGTGSSTTNCLDLNQAGNGTVLELTNNGTGPYLNSDLGVLINNAGSYVGPSRSILKENFVDIAPATVLAKVVDDLVIREYNFKRDPSETKIGPTAENFFATFGYGTDQGISPSDLASIALAAIKAQQSEIEQLKAEIEDLKNQ